MLEINTIILSESKRETRWAHEFHMEKQCIIGVLIDDGGSVSARHVGSTSIGGMPAKPIIDILVCPNKDVPLESCIPKLERIGYRNLGECGRPGRYFLSSGREPGKTLLPQTAYRNNINAIFPAISKGELPVKTIRKEGFFIFVVSILSRTAFKVSAPSSISLSPPSLISINP